MKSCQSSKTAIALALCSIVLGAWAGTAEAQTVKVGVQIPLTGERADVGKTMQNALQMAQTAINSKAGTNGPRVELVFADDQSDEEAGVKGLSKLIHDDQVVAIVGEINSPYVMASKPVVEKEGVSYLTGGTSPRTTQQAQWIFRAGVSDATLANLLAGYAAGSAAGQLNQKNVAILHDRTGIHNQRAGLVVSVLKDRYGIVPLVSATWSPGDTDFAGLFEQVKTKNAQLIIALGETPEGGPFFKQLKASGVKAQVIAHRDFGVKSALDDAAGGAEGALIATEYAPDLQSQATRDWAKAYNDRYGTAANVIAAQYYDALLLLAEAAKTGGANRAGVKAGLEKLKAFQGAMADYTFDAERNGVHRIFVAKVAGGKLSLVTTLKE